ncbi:MAG: hypothetical protein AAF745_16785, partial [Planctomycetota bacterium]
TIAAGQSFAIANVFAPIEASDADWPTPNGKKQKAALELVAEAMIHGRLVRRRLGSLGNLALKGRPDAILEIQPTGSRQAETTTDDQLHLRIRRGETITAMVNVKRKPDFVKEIPLGKEFACRNAPFGVYVDNIGLNGLLVRRGESKREFSLTADEHAELGTRHIHLMAAGGLTSAPVALTVSP